MAIIKQYRPDRDVTYCYESVSYWDPELKQARSKRKLIGKLDPETGEIVPTSGKPGRKKGSKNKSREEKAQDHQQVADAMNDHYRSLYEKQKDKNEQLREEVKALKKSLSALEKERNQLLNTMEKAVAMLSVTKSEA